MRWVEPGRRGSSVHNCNNCGASPLTSPLTLKGKRGVTPETALRLARYFGNTPQFWMNLQTRFDLIVAEQALGKRISSEVKPAA